MSTGRHVDPHPMRPSGARRSSGDGEEPDLIVSRGLQELLKKEQRKSASADRAAGARPSGKAAAKKRKGMATPRTGPNFVFCYLCGRQFGHQSIDFHRPQCYLKKMIEWERADKTMRGPKPVDPETHDRRMKEKGAAAGGDVGSYDSARMEAYNRAQMEAFTNTALVPCPNCGRTFLPDRLQVHLRSCKPGAAARPVRRPGAAGAEAAPAEESGSPPRAGSAGAGAAAARAGPTKSPSAARPEDRPIRASGSYAVPEGATEDSVPAAPAANSSAKGPGARPAYRRVSINAPPQAGRRKSRETGDDDILFEEEPIMPPSVAVRRRSESALAAEAAMETSSPQRPAAMGPDDHEEEEEQQMQFNGSVGPTPQPSSVLGNSRNSTSSNGGFNNNYNNNNNNNSTSSNDAQRARPAEVEHTDSPHKKIPLNNVSRFKNVQSRLKMEERAQRSSLVPCQFCGRTFNPDRIEKHESACLERDKAQQAPPPAKKVLAKRPATAPRKSASPAATDSAKFCSSCGSKLPGNDSKFCCSCGAKVAA